MTEDALPRTDDDLRRDATAPDPRHDLRAGTGTRPDHGRYDPHRSHPGSTPLPLPGDGAERDA